MSQAMPPSGTLPAKTATCVNCGRGIHRLPNHPPWFHDDTGNIDCAVPPALAERADGKDGMSIQTQTSLTALAQVVSCDTAETVRWEIAETLDKCAGTKERLLAQMRGGEDCDTCPPGFLAVVMQAEKLARALGIALDLLGVPAIDGSETV